MPRPANFGDFLGGSRRGMPVVLAVLPFGLLFGALAIDNGLSMAQTVLMSATIFGGASQMVGIELFGHHVAAWLVVFSIMAVNFRHVLYSAAIGPYMRHWPALQRWIGFFFLVDPQYAESEREAERHGRVSFAWYMGLAVPLYASWVVEAWAGALFGRLIPNPHALGIDFLLPVYFLGLVMGFRGRPLWLPVVAASAVVSIVAEQRRRLAVAYLHRCAGRRAARSRAHAGQRAEPARAGAGGPGYGAVSDTVVIILAGAALTYLTRIGGDLVLSRFENLHPRVEAGLNAVPAAVLTTLVAPAAMSGGPVELAALAAAGLVALRGGMLSVFLAGAAVLIGGRYFFG